jgi:hypothetical protein
LSSLDENRAPGVPSIVIFQNVFVNLAVVVVQACEQNFHDKLGSVCCEKEKVFTCHVCKSMHACMAVTDMQEPWSNITSIVYGTNSKFKTSKFSSIKDHVKSVM